MQRLEREIEGIAGREAALHERMAAQATDHERLRELAAELAALTGRRERAEVDWPRRCSARRPHALTDAGLADARSCRPQPSRSAELSPIMIRRRRDGSTVGCRSTLSSGRRPTQEP